MRERTIKGRQILGLVVFIVFGLSIIGCNENKSHDEVTSQTWKNAFPSLWSMAYAGDTDEPNPEDITYEEFLQAVVNALKKDPTFKSTIDEVTKESLPKNKDQLQDQEQTSQKGEPQGNESPITQSTLDALVARVSELETKLASVSVGKDINNYPSVTFSGVNLYINNRTGATNKTSNGTGNLIVGYNELRNSGNNRTGSHNIVVGMGHNYSSYCGFVAGYYNTISGEYSSVSGGHSSIASGSCSSVSGGYANKASGTSSSVSGGRNNDASGGSSSISGGLGNQAEHNYSHISACRNAITTEIYDFKAQGIQ